MLRPMSPKALANLEHYYDIEVPLSVVAPNYSAAVDMGIPSRS